MILALEASTSAAKAMLLHNGAVIDVISDIYEPAFADTVTIDADYAVDFTLRLGARLLASHGGPSIEAVGLSSIWHSLLCLDGDNRPLGRVLTWADTSCAATVAARRADGVLREALYSRTGCVIHSMYNLWKWVHLRQNGDISGVRRLSGMGEYFTFRLTGQHNVSHMLAAGSGFFNIHTRQYDDDALALAGITSDMLPVPREPGQTAPLSSDAAAILRLPAGTPVCDCVSDGGSNHIAAGGLSGQVLTLSVGTSGAVRAAAPSPILPQNAPNWCYYGAEDTYIAGAATSGAGNCVKWLRTLLGGYSYRQLDDLAAAASEASFERLPFFLPFLYGERSPGWDDARRGSFVRLDGESGPGALQYALLEGVVFHLYHNYTLLCGGLPQPPELISVSGGILQSPFWIQLAADIFGVTLRENTGEHASLLGAAYVAQKAAGEIASLRGITPPEGLAHTPDETRTAVLRQRFELWVGWYNAGA